MNFDMPVIHTVQRPYTYRSNPKSLMTQLQLTPPAHVDVKLPSFVDDMCMDIIDWEDADGGDQR